MESNALAAGATSTRGHHSEADNTPLNGLDVYGIANDNNVTLQTIAEASSATVVTAVVQQSSIPITAHTTKKGVVAEIDDMHFSTSIADGGQDSGETALDHQGEHMGAY